MTSNANDLTGRRRKRLEGERREIEELTTDELGSWCPPSKF
ncbi:hypothetical protein [Candidatus Palauibacter sp.]